MQAGTMVLAYLHTPKERIWGVLREQDASGIWLEGLDLLSFDDWARQVAREEPATICPSLVFYPMLRIEKLVVDRSSPGQPSQADRFEQMVGMRVEEHLDLEPSGRRD